jgi:hypothetical protein
MAQPSISSRLLPEMFSDGRLVGCSARSAYVALSRFAMQLQQIVRFAAYAMAL